MRSGLCYMGASAQSGPFWSWALPALYFNPLTLAVIWRGTST